MTPARTARLAPLQRPLPEQPPVYDHEHGHNPAERPFEVYGLLDTLFIVAGVVVSVWLALLYLVEGFSLTPVRLLYLVGFWILLTYITLPRLHQLMTWIYLPDYFFGRTRTTEGVLSDPINLAFDGPEKDVHVAMRRAGWVLAEERTVASAWGMVRATLLRRSYPGAPVSNLYLLGRRHDFTYQQEVGGTTTKRHHVRFWRMPKDFVLPGGYRADWLAAGTYDRAVGFSFFTLQVTHRIDENIDVERDYVIDAVRYADPEIPVEVIHEFSASYQHRNGQGDRIRTDGHLPVVEVTGAASRSDGATAVMLPRHRPSGTAVMKARAHAALAAARSRYAPGERARAKTAAGAEGERGAGAGPGIGTAAGRGDFADEIAAQWQGTVGDFNDALARAADHYLPPPTVVFTAALVLLQSGSVIAQWLARMLGADLSDLVEETMLLFPDQGALGIASVFSVVLVLLMIGVLRRSRWARIALMGMFTGDAVVRLVIATSTTGEVAHSLLVGAGASALGVLAISSDASRMWVQTLRITSRHEQDGAGTDEPEADDAGTDKPEVDEPEADEPEADGTEADGTGTDGTGQADTDGAERTGTAQAQTAQADTAQAGTAQAQTAQADTDSAETDRAGVESEPTQQEATERAGETGADHGTVAGQAGGEPAAPDRSGPVGHDEGPGATGGDEGEAGGARLIDDEGDART